MKKVSKGSTLTTTTYVRDASGNVMAIYKNEEIQETIIYGSSRLGQYRRNEEFQKTALGQRIYEFSNHLGNVLVTLSDNKVPQTDGTYSSVVVSASDYYPFGLAMAERTYQNSEYRYGFNGKEDDKDFGSHIQDYGFRLYSKAEARFLSVDPLAPDYPWYTPYQFAGNMPIWCIDLDGLEPVVSNEGFLVGYIVQPGQGPTQIAADINNPSTQAKYGYTIPNDKEISWESIVIHEQNLSYFVDADYDNGQRLTLDKDDSGFRRLNMNTGDYVDVTFIYNHVEPDEPKSTSNSSKEPPLLSRFALDGGLDFALLGGYGLHIGAVMDDDGEYGIYFTFNANVGLSGSAGIDVVPIFPSDGDKFTLDEWAGKGEEFNAQIGPIEIGIGGNVNNFMKGEMGQNYYTGTYPFTNLPSKNLLSPVIKEGIKTATGSLLDAEIGAGGRYTFSETWFIWRSDD